MIDEIYQHQSYLCLCSHYLLVLIEVACHCVESLIYDGKLGYSTICLDLELILGMSVEQK